MIVHGELKQHRCVMIYVEQVGKRHIDVRLTRVFTPITRAHHTQIWTLRSTVDARIANREDPIMRVDGNVDARATHRAILPCG